jgi:two-component system, LytTR family, sensor kinase
VPAETLEARVPAFVLQPLVENAIRHGIAPVLEPGRIVIAASAHGGTLAIEIADTGPGVSAEAARSQGVGLRNTRARLAQLYGAAAGLRLEHGAAGGTIATLWLPFRPGSTRTTPTNTEPIHAHS